MGKPSTRSFAGSVPPSAMALAVGSFATKTQSAGALFQTRLITIESVTTIKWGQEGNLPESINSRTR